MTANVYRSLSRVPLLLRQSLVLFAVFVVLLSTTSQAALTPRKSPNDPNSYRYLTLPNDLRVLLISNPQADKAAAALDINIGSGNDPVAYPGMAHFLEHMLFLGTRKYPEAGEYQAFISRHGGSHNAMTTYDHTNYFFDIDPKYLEPALDRFAQQFAEPLFNADLVERERHAVHSEYSAKLREDSRRFHEAFKQTLNPEHPYSHFSVGNLETLKDGDNGTLHTALLRFHQEHYSADRMTLALMGPQSLDQLEALARAGFAGLPKRKTQAETKAPPLFNEDRLPALLKVEAVKDIRRLQLSFPLPSQREAYRNKPAAYVAHLLGHEGEGSLLQVLKQASLADSLSAGLGMDNRNEAMLDISIGLTPQGLQRWTEVSRLTFTMIDKIRQEGIQRVYFEEEQKLMEIALRFQERGQPIDLVSGLAMQMHEVAPEDVLVAPWLMQEYQPDAYKAILAALTPENVLVRLLAPGLLDDKAPKEKWYQVPYTIEPLPQLAETQAVTELAKQLSLPAPNPFLPERLEVLEGPAMAAPERLPDTDGLKLWYAKDTTFGTPRANVYISFRSPVSNASAQASVLTSLWLKSVEEQLNTLAYPAQLAGLDYAVYPHLRGITVRVSGYNDKLKVLLQEVLQAVSATRFVPERFELHRRNLEEQLQNRLKQTPYEQAMRVANERLLPGSWPLEDRIAAATKAQLAEVRHLAGIFFKQLDTVMLAHGNLQREEAASLASTVNNLLKGAAIEVPRPKLVKLAPGLPAIRFPVQHNDTGYVRYLQGTYQTDLKTGMDERARYLLLAQILSAPFYEQLRTQEQLGYVVFASSFEMLEQPGLGLIIQSPQANADTLNQRVDHFLRGFADTLSKMPEAEFEQHRAGVITQLQEKEQRLDQISERFWQEIDRNNLAFDSKEQMIAAVKRVSQDELLALYRQQILEKPAGLLITTQPLPQSNTTKDSP